MFIAETNQIRYSIYLKNNCATNENAFLSFSFKIFLKYFIFCGLMLLNNPIQRIRQSIQLASIIFRFCLRWKLFFFFFIFLTLFICFFFFLRPYRSNLCTIGNNNTHAHTEWKYHQIKPKQQLHLINMKWKKKKSTATIKWTNWSALWGYRRLWTCTLCNTFVGIFFSLFSPFLLLLLCSLVQTRREILHPAPKKLMIYNMNFCKIYYLCLMFVFGLIHFVFIIFFAHRKNRISSRWKIVEKCVHRQIWLNTTTKMGSNKNLKQQENRWATKLPHTNSSRESVLCRSFARSFSLSFFLSFSFLSVCSLTFIHTGTSFWLGNVVYQKDSSLDGCWDVDVRYISFLF